MQFFSLFTKNKLVLEKNDSGIDAEIIDDFATQYTTRDIITNVVEWKILMLD